MSTGIHIFMEARKRNGGWRYAGRLAGCGQNYWLFGILSGVRQEPHPARGQVLHPGRPVDVSGELGLQLSGKDFHSHGYGTISEVLSWPGWPEVYPHTGRIYADLDGYRALKARGGLDPVPLGMAMLARQGAPEPKQLTEEEMERFDELCNAGSPAALAKDTEQRLLGVRDYALVKCGYTYGGIAREFLKELSTWAANRRQPRESLRLCVCYDC